MARGEVLTPYPLGLSNTQEVCLLSTNPSTYPLWPAPGAWPQYSLGAHRSSFLKPAEILEIHSAVMSRNLSVLEKRTRLENEVQMILLPFGRDCF